MVSYPCSNFISLIGLVFYLLLVLYMYQDYNGFSLFHPRVRANMLSRERFRSAGSNNVSYTSIGTTSSRPLADKLVNWFLLTSGLDPGSCNSRQESHKYRKPTAHKPSSYLVSKIRHYEELHERCGPYTEPYRATLRKFLTRSNNVRLHESNRTCNYIILKASGGLGNRMLSVASAFLYALLTDRVLLVDLTYSGMANLFCEPFHGSTWLLPKKLQVIIDNYSNEYGYTFESMRQRRNTTKNSSSTLQGNEAPLLVHVDLHSHSPDLHVFHCNDSQMILNGVQILILKSELYYVPSLFMASSFQEELQKLFPRIDGVFSLLSQFLFHPSDTAWEMITKFYEAYLANANQRVGLQIRLFDQDKVQGIHSSYMKQILSCVSSYNLLPRVKSNTTATVQPKNFSSSSKVYKTSVVVASLHSMYAKYLKNMYSSGDVNGHEVAVYQPTQEERQHSRNNQHNMKAWVDIYLLSMCDVIVTSADSTFGYVAQNIGGLTPWILDKPVADHVSSPPCKRALSMEPCFHNAPKFDCKTKSEIVNITSHFPYIQNCEDWIWNGLKLVPIRK